jgi:hypothetical protein
MNILRWLFHAKPRERWYAVGYVCLDCGHRAIAMEPQPTPRYCYECKSPRTHVISCVRRK